MILGVVCLIPLVGMDELGGDRLGVVVGLEESRE